MALKGRSRKYSQPNSCNETWSWKQYYQVNSIHKTTWACWTCCIITSTKSSWWL